MAFFILRKNVAFLLPRLLNIKSTSRVPCALKSTKCNKRKPSYEIKALPDSYGACGEGPHWDIERQSLYFVDINAGIATVLRYDHKQNKTYKGTIPSQEFASFIIPIEGKKDLFAIGSGRRVLTIEWDGCSPCPKIICELFDVQQDGKFCSNRFNDAKCDPCGRLFAGTMKYGGNEWEHRWGELYKYEPGGKVETAITNIGIANGLDWNAKTKKFYFIDTVDLDVKEYDYNLEKGEIICNPKQIYSFRGKCEKENLWPDGMCIDCAGNLYVATFNGCTVYKIDPCTCKVLLEIVFPVFRVTSCAFGGPNLDILFVTTSDRFGEPKPAGTTYAVTGLGAKGVPMSKMKL